MITAGGETLSPQEWAKVLVHGLLRSLYEDALVYIDDRGWFNNTFESTDDLDAEVQRVLDLRFTFGVVNDWPEFPFPQQWRPHFERRLRQHKRRELVAALIESILQNEKKYRGDAITYLQETAKGTRSAEQTVCLMWNLEKRCKKAATGGRPAGVGELRRRYGVSTGKQTICAEEVFLTKNQPWTQWVVSASYDLTHGWKAACKKGCGTLLEGLDITDLGRDLRWRAGRHEKVGSWSQHPD